MRARSWFLASAFMLGLTLPTSAQITSSFSSKTTGATIPSATPPFFSVPLAKPDFSVFSTRPSLPRPSASFMPAMPNFRDSWLGRNIFTGPAVNVQQAPPPPQKKAP